MNLIKSITYLKTIPFTIKMPPIVTEDLGKIMEMSICLLYDIDYIGKFKYSITEAEKLSLIIKELKVLFPYNIIHTAQNGYQYDFTCVDNEFKLSAKTSKRDGKVCPQVIGQPSKKTFCKYFQLPYTTTIEQIKEFIFENTSLLLNKYFKFTFDSSIIYYNKKKNLTLFITKKKDIDWFQYKIEFSHIKKQKKWNESTTININGISIGEFQVHNHRDSIKFRWCFEKLLINFKDNFEIIYL